MKAAWGARFVGSPVGAVPAAAPRPPLVLSGTLRGPLAAPAASASAPLSLQARSLLHQFRLRPRIPCSLHDLCQLCGSGMWDSGYMPAVECAGHRLGSESCPYGGTAEMPSPTPPGERKKGPKTPREGFGFRR